MALGSCLEHWIQGHCHLECMWQEYFDDPNHKNPSNLKENYWRDRLFATCIWPFSAFSGVCVTFHLELPFKSWVQGTKRLMYRLFLSMKMVVR